MIEVSNLTKRYGQKTAVQDLTFSVRPGKVTGFLGPNGAGKSTTMRMILGLDNPTTGHALVEGKPFADHAEPSKVAAALLDATWVHPSRPARAHLEAQAAYGNIPASRVNEVLDLVGLRQVAKKKVGGFSLGMRQRLGLAAAMLGDPKVLMFDEPVNGLDPEGILWVRNFMKARADEGRTVLVSSHLLSEMALTAEDLIVIGKGKLRAQTSVHDLVATQEATILVRTPDATDFAAVLRENGFDPQPTGESQQIAIKGKNIEQVGRLAFDNSVLLHQLYLDQPSLEQAFMALTQDDVEYRTGEPIAEDAGQYAAGPKGPGAHANHGQQNFPQQGGRR
ncbi:MAG TPA: ABC transporter ATP-binding protein [Dietzia timorensis]|uniref:ABC transporter ATP-binding protein n=1 Tax=Dietzia timorensis TaxID=499555 RepID=A0A921JYT9_9ACTN|nr:ABC transporter ATP-binding protein [Dietzia timorensis]HJE90216.1 ABC transporter ATP-binding protein [Dietzia timorensis]